MSKLLVILFVALVLEAIGVVYLSRGLKQIGHVDVVNGAAIIRVVKAGAVNPNILLGVFFEALFFVGLLILMSKSDVSFIWPLTSLGFVLTTLAAKFVLHEQVSGLRWLGVCLIMVGAGLITYTEKHKPNSTPPVHARQALNAKTS